MKQLCCIYQKILLLHKLDFVHLVKVEYNKGVTDAGGEYCKLNLLECLELFVCSFLRSTKEELF